MKILTVDDDVEFCEGLADVLKDEGYLVDTAFDGIQGDQLIQKNKYDIVLIDFKMPGLSGIDLLKKIKDICPCTKVFMISGKPNIHDIVEYSNMSHCLEAIIPKPIDIEKLLVSIKNLC